MLARILVSRNNLVEKLFSLSLSLSPFHSCPKWVWTLLLIPHQLLHLLYSVGLYHCIANQITREKNSRFFFSCMVALVSEQYRFLRVRKIGVYSCFVCICNMRHLKWWWNIKRYNVTFSSGIITFIIIESKFTSDKFFAENPRISNWEKRSMRRMTIKEKLFNWKKSWGMLNSNAR